MLQLTEFVYDIKGKSSVVCNGSRAGGPHLGVMHISQVYDLSMKKSIKSIHLCLIFSRVLDRTMNPKFSHTDPLSNYYTLQEDH